MLDRVFVALQERQSIQVRVEAVSLDSTAVKGHPDGMGARKKNGPQAIGKSRAGWTTKIHLVAADARTAVNCSVSPGHAGDAPAGRAWLKPSKLAAPYVIMDRAYEGDETRQLVREVAVFRWCPEK